MSLPTIVTERLRLRPFVAEDAAYIVAQLGDPEFIRFVGDRGVGDEAAAIEYLKSGPWASYESAGYGPWAVEVLGEDAVIGMCGLFKRDDLDAPELGFAFLPEGRGRGFALEAARASIAWAERTLGLTRILAITTDDHARSQRILEALGMRFIGHVRIAGDPQELRLYAREG